MHFDALSKNTKYKVQAKQAKQELHFVHFDATALSKDDDDAYTLMLRTLRCYVHFDATYTSMQHTLRCYVHFNDTYTSML